MQPINSIAISRSYQGCHHFLVLLFLQGESGCMNIQLARSSQEHCCSLASPMGGGCMPQMFFCMFVLTSHVLIVTSCAGTDSTMHRGVGTQPTVCPQHSQPLHLPQAPLLISLLSLHRNPFWPRQQGELPGGDGRWHGCCHWLLGQLPQDLELTSAEREKSKGSMAHSSSPCKQQKCLPTTPACL